MLVMRGLAKLSQAVAETQGSALRGGAGRPTRPSPPSTSYSSATSL